ncbi:MAG: sulfatase family protein [Planctomycetota bacterium]|jgi:arylsulfatase A-like enzyme
MINNHHAITLTLIASFTCLNPVARAAAPATPQRPNLLFILTDDHALEAIGAYGTHLQPYVKTPTLDRLAREGVTLSNVACNNSICSPSRASIITGQYSHINTVRGLNQGLPDHSPSYNIVARAAGYQTAVIGKWHMEHTPRGMDYYAVTKKQGNYFDPSFITPDGAESHTGYYADVYTDKALAWLEARDRDRPFVLNLHFKGPHHPYDYPPRHEGLLKGVKIAEPGNLYEDNSRDPDFKAKHWGHMDDNRGYYDRHASELGDHDASTREGRISAAYQHMMHKYIRCVAAIDENIARVIERLESEGVLDNTLVVYSSDQGYWLGQHGFYDKRLILEESLKMPFIARLPGVIPAGSTSDALVSNVDFAPTFLDYLGAPAPDAMQGRSFRGVLEGRANEHRDALWYAYWLQDHYGIRTQRYKYFHIGYEGPVALYDLARDPYEMNDVARDPAYASTIEQLEEAMQRAMREAGVVPDRHLPGSPGILEQEKNRRRAKNKID